MGLQGGLIKKPERNDNLEDISIDVTKILRRTELKGGLIQKHTGK
jgi:hypothetical protein